MAPKAGQDAHGAGAGAAGDPKEMTSPGPRRRHGTDPCLPGTAVPLRAQLQLAPRGVHALSGSARGLTPRFVFVAGVSVYF